MASPSRQREDDMKKQPSGYPDCSIELHEHEVRFLTSARNLEFGNGVLFYNRISIGAELSEAIGFKGCKEIQGPHVEYLETEFGKHVLLSWPLVPESSSSALEPKWV